MVFEFPALQNIIYRFFLGPYGMQFFTVGREVTSAHFLVATLVLGTNEHRFYAVDIGPINVRLVLDLSTMWLELKDAKSISIHLCRDTPELLVCYSSLYHNFFWLRFGAYKRRFFFLQFSPSIYTVQVRSHVPIIEFDGAGLFRDLVSSSSIP
jgi:hypothetical protein